MVSYEAIKELREMTSAGIMDCKDALEKADGDLKKALQILKEKGAQIASKKSTRITKEGKVESYVHLGGKIGVLVEVDCETDFVARNEEFGRFVKDLAMQIAASSPLYIKREDVPKELVEKQEDAEKFYKEVCLLDQPFIKDESITIKDYLTSLIAKVGENIVIKRFTKFQVGLE
jgi:elongation factor Ts